MPEGYATPVGERGLKLSGGEKQRVAIARAFLRNPRLLVCDEATSALDSATEASIMASLRELAQGRTSLFVAHRLSTVRACDKIVVLEEGRVREQGTHDELMALGGAYRAMWELQARAAAKAEAQVAASGDGIDAGGAGSSNGSNSSGSALTATSEAEDDDGGTAGIVEPLPTINADAMRSTMAAP
jgi:ABC-type multidrug transport system ATPase subunit